MAHFLALPLVAKVTGLLIAAALFLYGWMKRKVIAAALSAITKAAKKKFWGWAHEQMKASEPPAPSDQRTYRGTFQWYARSYRQFFFTLEHDGATIKVPVAETDLFAELRRGDSVVIDTQVGIYIGEEVVLRVHKLNKAK
jgi:hypothetical protein